MKHFISFLIVALYSSLLPAQEKVKIAVLDLKARTGIDKMTVSSLTDYTCTVISELGDYEVIGKDDMRAMLEHVADKQLLDCDDTKCLTKLGGALGVELLVSGNIGMVGTMYLINLKLIDIENAAVKNRLSEEYRGDETGLVSQLKVCVHKLFNAAPPETPPQEPVPAPKKMQPAQMQPEEEVPGRQWKITVQPGAGFNTYQGAGQGFSIGVGLQFPKNYFGIGIIAVNHNKEDPYPGDMGFEMLDKEKQSFNGGALVYYRKLNGSRRIGFYIGGFLGVYRGEFEKYDGKKDVYHDPYLDLLAWEQAQKGESNFTGIFGPKLKFDIGSSWWRIGAEATLLLGPEGNRQFLFPEREKDTFEGHFGAAGQLDLVLSLKI